MISITNLSKTYYAKDEEPVMALNGIHVEFADTGLVSVVGPSGCGKTTFLNILGGFDTASSGTIRINGTDIESFTEAQWDEYRASQLGFVFQAYNLIDELTVEKNLQLPMMLNSAEADSINEKIEALASKFGIQELLPKKVKHLSGGQKQRVAILRALLKEPTVVLADEPTGNLDQENSRLVYEMLKKISEDCLVIVVSHNRELSEQYSDRIIELSYGVIQRDEERKPHTKQVVRHEPEKGKRGSLPFSFCVSMVLESLRTRFVRFTISVIMLVITMTLIILSAVCFWNDRGSAIASYLRSTDQKVYTTYTTIDYEYKSYRLDNLKEMGNGEMLHKLLANSVGEQRLIRLWHEEAVYKDSSNMVALFGLSKEPLCGQEYPKALTGNQVIVNRTYAAAAGLSEEDCPVEAQISGLCDAQGIDVISSGGANDIANIERSFGRVQKDQELVAGRWPEKENEIVVAKVFLDRGLRSVDQVLDKEFYTYDLRKEQYGNAYYDIVNLYDIVGEKVKVVGVVDDDQYDYFFFEKTYDRLITELVEYTGEYAFACEEDELEKYVSVLDANGMKIDERKLSLLYALWDDFDGMAFAFLSAIVIMGILTMLQMITAFSYSIKDSEHKIGVFRSLGIPQKNVNLIFVLESITITVIAELIASLAVVLAIWKINRHFIDTVLTETSIHVYVPRVSVWLICLLAILLLYNFVVMIPLNKMKKKKVIHLLLNE